MIEDDIEPKDFEAKMPITGRPVQIVCQNGLHRDDCLDDKVLDALPDVIPGQTLRFVGVD